MQRSEAAKSTTAWAAAPGQLLTSMAVWTTSSGVVMHLEAPEQHGDHVGADGEDEDEQAAREHAGQARAGR